MIAASNRAPGPVVEASNSGLYYVLGELRELQIMILACEMLSGHWLSYLHTRLFLSVRVDQIGNPRLNFLHSISIVDCAHVAMEEPAIVLHNVRY